MIIYKITNTINGKIYIGQTILSLNKRRDGHVADSKRDRVDRCKSKISRAIAKYGIDSFSFEVICEVKSQIELNQLESEYIALYGSTADGIGYNLLSGGHQNGKHSTETKLKQSQAGKRVAMVTVLVKGSHWNTGRSHSEEHNAKISKAIKGIPCPQRGYSNTDEQRRLRSEKMKLFRSRHFWSTKKKTITSA